MSSPIDILLAITLKLVLMVGFILLIKLWLKKKTSIAPIIAYAVLGFFFVLMLSYQIFEYLITILIYDGSNIDKIGPISAILGLIVYVLIYTKYLKKFRKAS